MLVEGLDKIKRGLAKAYVYASSPKLKDGRIDGVRSALLVDITNEAECFSQDIYTSYPIASLTKAVSATYFLSRYAHLMEEEIEVKGDILDYVDKDRYMNVGLKEGDRLKYKSLLAQSVIISACDSALLIAGQNEDQIANYIEEMTNFAKDIGLKKATFIDPAGMDDRNSMTSYDAFILSKYLVNNHMDQVNMLIEEGLFITEETGYKSTSPKFYSKKGLDVISIKTGYLKSAGRSIMLYIEDPIDRREYILIIIGAKRLIYRDVAIEILVREYIDKSFRVGL